MDIEEHVNAVRMPWNVIPTTREEQNRIPISVIYSPLQPLPFHVQGGLNYDPKYCSVCGGVLNYYSQVDFDLRTWECCFCNTTNQLPIYYNQPEEKYKPTELSPFSTRIEYDLGIDHDNKVDPIKNVYFLVVDRCMELHKFEKMKNIILSALDGLSHTTHFYIGLITIDGGLSCATVHQLDHPHYNKIHFDATVNWSHQQIADKLGISTFEGFTKLIRGPQDDELREVLQSLTSASVLATPKSERPARCTGTAISIAASIISRYSLRSHFGYACGRRIMAFLGGPATIGRAIIVQKQKVVDLRSHADIKNGEASLFRQAVGYYTQLAEFLVQNRCALDVFSCAPDEVGLAELKVAVEQTGGLVVSSDSCNESFSKSVHRAFQYSNDGIRLSANATFEVKCSTAMKIQGVLGPCASLKKIGPSCSTTAIGQGSTAAWILCGLDVSAALCIFFDIEQKTTHDPVYIQFLTRYIHRTGSWKLRVTTIKRECAIGRERIKNLAMGFDEEAAAIVLGRLVSHKIETKQAFCPIEWLDETLMHMLVLFQRHRPIMTKLSELVFYMRRSQLIETINASPDETTFFRLLFNRSPVPWALMMIRPSITSFKIGQNKTELPFKELVSSNAFDNDKILVIDSFIRVVVLRGSSSANVNKHWWTQKDTTSWIESTREHAISEAESPMRFPVPGIIITTQGEPQALYLADKLNLGLIRDTGNFEFYFTKLLDVVGIKS